LQTFSSNYPQTLPPAFTGQTAVTIGNFDGLHLGHQQLIKTAKSRAMEIGGKSLVISFSPHPDFFFRPSSPPEKMLFTDIYKQNALAELGVDFYLQQSFTTDFASLEPLAFVEHYLIDLLKCRALVVGADFRFGRRRAGDVNFLSRMANEKGMQLDVIKQESFLTGEKQVIVSSSLIRQMLREEGNTASAQHLLARPYLLAGVIGSGQKRGRTIGLPTLNLRVNDLQLVPKNGVYFGYCWLPGEGSKERPPVFAELQKLKPAVINIGTNPSVTDDLEIKIEAHLFNDNLGLDTFYDQPTGFYLMKRLRDEKRFGDLNELKTAIKNDIQQAQEILLTI